MRFAVKVGYVRPSFLIFRMLWLPVASFFAGVLNTIAGGDRFCRFPLCWPAPPLLAWGRSPRRPPTPLRSGRASSPRWWPSATVARIRLELCPSPRIGRRRLAGRLAASQDRQQDVPRDAALAAAVRSGHVCAQLSARPLAAKLSGGRRYNTWLLIGMVLVSVYVGYFGAGGGFLVDGAVRHLRRPRHPRDECAQSGDGGRFHRNSGDHVHRGGAGGVAILPGDGDRRRRSAVTSAAHYSRRVNQRAMRWTVATIGFVTAGYFFLQNYMHHP